MLSLKSFDVYSATEVKALSAENLNQLLSGFKPKKVLVLDSPREELGVTKLVTALIEQKIQLAEAILEHNNVDLSGKEQEAFNTVTLFYARLKTEQLNKGYPWLNNKTDLGAISCGVKRVTLNGYSISIEYAQKLWEIAAEYWQEGIEKPLQFYYSSITRSSTYSNKSIIVEPTRLCFGCQTFSRSNVEAIAKHYNWPTPPRKV